MAEYCKFSGVKKPPPVSYIEKLLEQQKIFIEFVKSRNKQKNVTSFVEMLESQIDKEINET